ncbi:hypothetical protein [Marinobacter qingdaonensis]|uniref:Uncharacterized protein n=1 Tax=Marinobacter qingdaonensis TaxID=3108486 RepID=A0ABU5NUU1_9GAMM|nr:hypothetical protein [Marinobacter sp. ASW11-75]MEA1079544.1 hypothetical protein [Marinobacter sp. ASW11-75]
MSNKSEFEETVEKVFDEVERTRKTREVIDSLGGDEDGQIIELDRKSGGKIIPKPNTRNSE